MNIIKINDSEFDTTSPTNNEFTKQYIKSFGDEIKVSVEWTHVNGFYLNLKSNINDEFDVEIFDNDDVLLYKSKLTNNMFCRTYRQYFNTFAHFK